MTGLLRLILYSLYNLLGFISNFLWSTLTFIFSNFFAILGAILLVFAILSIFHSRNDTGLLCKGSAILLLAGSILHIYLFHTTKADGDLLLTAARGVLPVLLTFFIACFFHNPPYSTLRECIVILIAFLSTYLLSGILAEHLMYGLSLIGGLLLIISIFTIITNQWIMDYNMQDSYGDSDKVRKLYKKGYRPSNYYKDTVSRNKAINILNEYGINPYDDEHGANPYDDN